ncbi:unnamed protein product [Alopecurus aequalis]
MVNYSLPKLACYLVLAIAMAAAVGTPPCAAQNAPSDFVSLHNTPRTDVGVGSVTWDVTVAAYAQNYANSRKTNCTLVHSGGPYGENLFWSSSSIASASDAVAAWVSEKQYYDHTTNTCSAGHVCGHYTQVVWRSSTAIGCARVNCVDSHGGVFIICNYNPPGNYVGQSPY